MRRILLAVASLAVLTVPVLADELADARAAIEAAALSDEADMYMWCGAAFTIMTAMVTDADQQKMATDAAGALFEKASPMLTEEGIADADFAKLSENYTVLANSQLVTKLEEPAYTQEECTTAAGA